MSDKSNARLTLDVDRELHARLKVVAARRRMSLRRYSVEAIEQRLAEEPEMYLRAEEAPALASLWDNCDDAEYDEL